MIAIIHRKLVLESNYKKYISVLMECIHLLEAEDTEWQQHKNLIFMFLLK